MFSAAKSFDLGSTIRYGTELAEQLGPVEVGPYFHHPYKLRSVASNRSGRVLGLLSRDRGGPEISLELWLCELELSPHSDSYNWVHRRRFCCGRMMGTRSGGSLRDGCSVRVCSQCRAMLDDAGDLGPADLRVNLVPDVVSADNASYCMTVDFADGVWLFIDALEDTSVCWYIGASADTKQFRLPVEIQMVSTASAVSFSQIYVQFGYEDCGHGILSKDGEALTFVSWPEHWSDKHLASIGDDDKLRFDTSFNGRLVRLGDILVGLANNGLWTILAKLKGFRNTCFDVSRSDYLWQKVLDLPEDDNAHARVLGLGYEKNQVIVFCSTKLHGMLHPARFLHPTHAVQLVEAPSLTSSECVPNQINCTARQLSSLVLVPLQGETLYQDQVPNTDSLGGRNWNSNILQLAMGELRAIGGGSCPGRSTLLFGLCGYVYRIWDEEILSAGAGWRPPPCSFDPSRADVVFSFQQSSHEEAKLKCGVQPLLRYKYFKALLSGWQESQKYEVRLDGTELASFHDILRYVHTGEVTGAPLSRTIDLLGTASKYMIEDLVALLLRSLRLALSNSQIVRDAEKEDLLKLLLITEVIGDDGIGLMKDTVAAVLNHRLALLRDAKFMIELGTRSATAFEALMDWTKDGGALHSRSRLFKKQLTRATPASWSVFSDAAIEPVRSDESASGCRARSRSPCRLRG